MRHYLFTRGRVSSDILLTALSPLLPSTFAGSSGDDGGAAHAGVAAALAGAAKGFVVQLAEAAVALAALGGHAGPLRESHVLDAWRRLQAAGALAGMPPRTGYCCGGEGAGEGDAGSDGGGGGGGGGSGGDRGGGSGQR